MGEAVDSYIPKEEAYIAQVLSPFEQACNMLCYVPKRSRKIAALIAKEMVSKGNPVSVRYLNLIERSIWWTCSLRPIPRRFEMHFDGHGVKALFNSPEPEKVLWKHLEWMRKYKHKMVDKVSHRRYMAFDEESRVETFAEFPGQVIEDYLKQYAAEDFVYIGVSRSDLR